MIKDIKLSQKKNGKGYVTSYSVNIGSGEAKLCGFIDNDGHQLPLEKFVDPENKEIIIRIKAEE